MAMKYHPDKNKWDKTSEAKFKEANEAYSTLSDSNKRKQYDTFWNSSWNFYWNKAWNASWFSWFEDIFWWTSSWSSFDFWDLFWNTRTKKEPIKEEKPNLDIEKTVEIPFFDFLFWTSTQVNNWIWKTVTIKIKEWTKPWIKMRVKWYWRALGKEVWNLIVKVDAKMPKEISETDTKILKSVKQNILY